MEPANPSTDINQRQETDAQYSYAYPDVIPNRLTYPYMRSNPAEHDTSDTTAVHEVLSSTASNSEVTEDEQTRAVLDNSELSPYEGVISTQSSNNNIDYQRLDPLTRELSSEQSELEPTNYQSLSSPSLHIYEELQAHGGRNTTEDLELIINTGTNRPYQSGRHLELLREAEV